MIHEITNIAFTIIAGVIALFLVIVVTGFLYQALIAFKNDFTWPNIFKRK